jgi:high-affinity nickel-transport protein
VIHLPEVPALLAAVAATAGDVGLIATALVLGLRHGLDWDHLAAITDITSTTAAADAATEAHETSHRRLASTSHEHDHEHGGPSELATHGDGAAPVSSHAGAAAATQEIVAAQGGTSRPRWTDDQRHAVLLGTLYALGHAAVVAVLGLAALLLGAILPDWVDPIMGKVVGATLLLLGIWVFVSLYRYARHGTPFRLRSRWMLVFDGARYAWRRLNARFHGHEHVDPLEMSSYGRRTAFGVGMIHGVGAETGTQVLLIAAVGGAAQAGLGVPMMLAFILGLVLTNTAIVVISATGFVASQLRERLYIALGLAAGAFSIVVGTVFLLGQDALLPALDGLFGPLSLP